MKALKPYMAFSKSITSEDGAILVLAHDWKTARGLAWGHCWNVTDWLDQGIRLIHDPSVLLLADQVKLHRGVPHIVESPLGCEACGYWGGGLTDDNRCGYCDEYPGDALIQCLTKEE